MATKLQLKEFLIKYDKDIEKKLNQNITIANATQELCNEGLIDFDFNYRECAYANSWIQCEYFSEKLNKVIIVDYDVREDYESIDDLIDTLAMYMEQVDCIEARII